jgi:hypothetical protein
MVDGISNSSRRTAADQHASESGAVAPRYVELDVDSIRTPLTCLDAPAKTTLFVDGISPSDVRQGDVGDCTLQATLASLARTPAGRSFLKDHVHENRDAAGNVTSYSVSLFKKNASGAYEPTRVNVPTSCLASRGFAHAVDHDGAVEVWPRVFEQAMLQVNAGAACSNMPEAMSILTGKPAVDLSTSDANLGGKLARGFGAGKVQVLSTTGKIESALDEPKLKPAHAYTLAAIEARPVRQPDGSYHVEELYVLRNPWGFDNPRPLTIDEVKKYFSTYSEGDVP